ncbi:MAG: hypothetical protein ABI068_03490 [Ktedonobacterales bacterium]
MIARILGGIAGWLVGVLPLVIVNLVGFAGTLDPDQAALAGAIGLVGGVMLGGVVAGFIGGRSGGVGGALLSGGLAALLYVASVGGLLIFSGSQGDLPNIILEHPIRVGVAVLCVGAMLLMLTLLVGFFSSRGQRQNEAPINAGQVGQVGQQSAYTPQRAPQPAYTRSLDQHAPSSGLLSDPRYAPAPRSRPLADADREPYPAPYAGPRSQPQQPAQQQPQRTLYR